MKKNQNKIEFKGILINRVMIIIILLILLSVIHIIIGTMIFYNLDKKLKIINDKVNSIDYDKELIQEQLITMNAQDKKTYLYMPQIYNEMHYYDIQNIAKKNGFCQNQTKEKIINLLPKYKEIDDMSFIELKEYINILSKIPNISTKNNIKEYIKTINVN